MIHANYTDWTSLSDRPEAVPASDAAAALTLAQVATAQAISLQEASSVAVTDPMQILADPYSMDTAAAAAGIAGVCLMIVGGALLARRLRLWTSRPHSLSATTSTRLRSPAVLQTLA